MDANDFNPEDLSPEERSYFKKEMKVNQLLLAAITIVGNAPSVLAGRVELCEFADTLADEEMAGLFCAAVETCALKIAMDTGNKDEFNEVLHHVGAIMALLAEGNIE